MIAVEGGWSTTHTDRTFRLNPSKSASPQQSMCPSWYMLMWTKW
jgi:hypothetical protein